MAAAVKQATAEMLFTHEHKLLDKFKLLLSNKLNVCVCIHFNQMCSIFCFLYLTSSISSKWLYSLLIATERAKRNTISQLVSDVFKKVSRN